MRAGIRKKHMNIIFKKSVLPFIKKFEERSQSPRDCWTLARHIQSEDGFCAQDASIFMLLQEGALKGDPFSMCELGRYLYDKGDAFLPVVLSWWHKAARLGDEGAAWDIQNRPLLERVGRYSVKGGYADMEMRCVMLTDIILLRSGRDVWDKLPYGEKESRIRALIDACARQLFLPGPLRVRLEPDFRIDGGLADGCAMKSGELVIRREVAGDFSRLIQVIFHELGHFAEFEAERNPARRALFGLSDDRVASWARGDRGLEVSTFEEDADTLSYGVFTHYAILFG